MLTSPFTKWEAKYNRPSDGDQDTAVPHARAGRRAVPAPGNYPAEQQQPAAQQWSVTAAIGMQQGSLYNATASGTQQGSLYKATASASDWDLQLAPLAINGGVDLNLDGFGPSAGSGVHLLSGIDGLNSFGGSSGHGGGDLDSVFQGLLKEQVLGPPLHR